MIDSSPNDAVTFTCPHCLSIIWMGTPEDVREMYREHLSAVHFEDDFISWSISEEREV